MTRRRPGGFSLVELMIVVAILGVLAAIAVPVFQRYLVNAKMAEAPMMLRKIVDGASAYFAVDHADSTGSVFSAQFPATTGWYPAELPIGTKVTPGPNDPPPEDQQSWHHLHFTLTQPVQFRYRFVTSGAGSSARADAVAESQIVLGNTCRLERSLRATGGSTLELQTTDVKVITPPY